MATPDRILLTESNLSTPGPLKTAFDGKASKNHRSTHAAGGSDPITPADIGAMSEAEMEAAIQQAIQNLQGGADIKVGGSAPASGWWLASGAPEHDPIAPSVPTGLAAAATGATTVQIRWAASTDNVAVTGYEYRIGSGSPVDAGTGESENVGSLSASTSYSFQVRAYDAAGNRSDWSTSASATTLAGPDTTAPTPGTLTSSAITTSGFTLTITGASDAGSGLHATPYRFSTDNGTTWSAWQSSPSFAVTGKSPSTTYQCKHQVRDAASTPNQATGATLAIMTAAPAPIASDDFNRANSSAGGLGTTSIGGKAWVDPLPNWAIQSNRAGSTTLGGGYALLDVGTPNVRVEADLTLIDESRGANEQVNLIFRRGSSDAEASHHIRLTVIAESMKLQVMEPDQDILDDDAKVIYTFPTPFGANDTRRVGCVLKEVAGSTQLQLLYEGAVVLTRTTSRSTRPVTGNFVGLHNGWDRFHVDNYTVWEA